MTVRSKAPDLAAAYTATGQAWQSGPGRIYDRLADVLADHCPVPLGGALALDLGAGTGAASKAARRRGARVVAVDVAVGMLSVAAKERPPAVAGDALHLPFEAGAFDAVLAAFSLTHLADPVPGLREAARVLRSGGGLAVAAFGPDNNHPVKAATDAAAADRGWQPESWYTALQRDAVTQLETVERAQRAADAAGLADAVASIVDVAFPDLEPRDLVAWRLGMAQLAPFVQSLPEDERHALAADATARLGPNTPQLVSSVVILTWQKDRGRRG